MLLTERSPLLFLLGLSDVDSLFVEEGVYIYRFPVNVGVLAPDMRLVFYSGVNQVSCT